MKLSVFYTILVINVLLAVWVKVNHHSGTHAINAIYYTGETAPVGYPTNTHLISFETTKGLKNPLGELVNYLLFEFLYSGSSI